MRRPTKLATKKKSPGIPGRTIPPRFPPGAGGFTGRPAACPAFTLIEMLLAVTILGSGLAVLLVGASRCLAVMRMARNYQTAQWVLTNGDAVHFPAATNSVEELEVEADGSLADGFTYSRHVEPDDNEDGLCIVRTRVSWNDRGREVAEEMTSFVHDPAFTGRKP